MKDRIETFNIQTAETRTKFITKKGFLLTKKKSIVFGLLIFFAVALYNCKIIRVKLYMHRYADVSVPLLAEKIYIEDNLAPFIELGSLYVKYTISKSDVENLLNTIPSWSQEEWKVGISNVVNESNNFFPKSNKEVYSLYKFEQSGGERVLVVDIINRTIYFRFYGN